MEYRNSLLCCWIWPKVIWAAVENTFLWMFSNSGFQFRKICAALRDATPPFSIIPPQNLGGGGYPPSIKMGAGRLFHFFGVELPHRGLSCFFFHGHFSWEFVMQINFSFHLFGCLVSWASQRPYHDFFQIPKRCFKTSTLFWARKLINYISMLCTIDAAESRIYQSSCSSHPK